MISLVKRISRGWSWYKLKNKHLSEYNICVSCGGKRGLVVHHIIPVHVSPELTLDRTNLITLCTRKKYGVNCHLLVGHFGNWKKFNPNVERDSRLVRQRINPYAET